MNLDGLTNCTKKLSPLVAVLFAYNVFAGGEPKMPTLNWMGREKATNAVKDVVMKILREDKSLGGPTGSVSSLQTLSSENNHL